VAKTIYTYGEMQPSTGPIFINPRLNENPFYTGVMQQRGSQGLPLAERADLELKPDWQRAAQVFRWAEQERSMFYTHELRDAMPETMPNRFETTRIPLYVGERAVQTEVEVAELVGVGA
jgi:hypothetical protein